jgi:hypothetical protein
MASAAHAADILAEMLSRGEAPTLDVCLAFCPNEPLADLDERGLRWMTPREHAKWWKRAAELRMEYPGFQAAHWCLERMKYGNLPNPCAQLGEFVRARDCHAKALWSSDISAGWTQLQFPDWLRWHINGETWIPPVWPDNPGWSEALQILRMACGFPGFDPTITRELRPPPRSASKL